MSILLCNGGLECRGSHFFMRLLDPHPIRLCSPLHHQSYEALLVQHYDVLENHIRDHPFTIIRDVRGCRFTSTMLFVVCIHPILTSYRHGHLRCNGLCTLQAIGVQRSKVVSLYFSEGFRIELYPDI